MFPKEIVEILQKYKDNIILNNINCNISNIIDNLYSLNESLAEQIKILVLDKNVDNNGEEVMKDSKILRKYIKSIQLLDVVINDTNNQNNEISDEITPESLIMPKPVKLYLCEDKICPTCGCSMDETYTSFTENKKTVFEKKTIDTYRCNCCNRFFVCEDVIKEIDLTKTNLVINKEFFNKIPQIDIYSIIVLDNTLQCSSKHNQEDFLAQLPGIDENGKLSYYTVNASYCSICNRFTVLKEQFNKIKDIITCKVIDNTVENNVSNNNEFESEQEKSILTYYGYNVQTKKNISKQQRHIILSSLIESKIMSRREVIDHIDSLIKRGSKIPSWTNATQKWKDDIDFVNSYKSNDLPKIVFDKIILKYKNQFNNR